MWLQESFLIKESISVASSPDFLAKDLFWIVSVKIGLLSAKSQGKVVTLFSC